ncbi:glycoside hydrolase family 43 protein [Sphingomonas sp. KR1UV-12]|uniref:Glycoside hydrolase family 43 protein n=1 Tax=Sphingomonas aurea TaxID=3063994 RepID=A0ABT9EJ27_9SPHN|nr:glycoside hydrolase family 43 protein [Sphingomonas sp. KR1UV-12]MDP1026648.1 glycoside hydrolase family 43 protein [Sphingomonas sp. KR1UV-12]
MLLLGAGVAAQADTPATNPLLPSGPDPWIVRSGDTYYYMATEGKRLAIRRTRDLARLDEAEPVTVWTPPATGPNAQSIWAPELHRIDGRWFIYYTAAASGHDDDAHRGIFVLENEAADPTTGRWTDRGRIATRWPGIDATTFAYRGRRYLVYSPYVGPDSVLAIAPMRDPWTLAGPERIIARPDRAWERQGGRQILEGPEFLQGPSGRLFLTYSASACWSDDYALGLLSAPAGSDPLDPAAWTKAPAPVLKSNPAGSVFAPGHNGVFTKPDGSTWIVYHANPRADMKCTAARAPHIQRVRWTDDGRPVFAPPAAGPVGG